MSFPARSINGFAANVGEVESAVNRFRDAVQTVSMFGGKRVVWLKDVNFLADTVTGRAESTLKLVEDLQQILERLNPDETAVLITAAPIDRRRSFPKWCEKNADFTARRRRWRRWRRSARRRRRSPRRRRVGATFCARTPSSCCSPRSAPTPACSSRKRASSRPTSASGATIEEKHVAELTPNVAEGDFFEAAEAFFSGDLKWTLAALHRHFFSGGDARPVISALQNRNRILLQVRALVDAGEVRRRPARARWLAKAPPAHAAKFTGATEKSSYNLFSQNPWYLGKLAGSAKLPRCAG